MGVDQTNSARTPPGTTAELAWEALLDLGTGPGSRVERLERAVRDAVHTGRVPVGAALPPSRQLAESLGVSRWVVTEAYGQLVAEGFLEARTGSATRVSAATRPTSPEGARAGAGRGVSGRSREGRAAEGRPAPAAVDAGRPDAGRAYAARARFDLAPGVPDLRHVPRDAWLRAAREALGTSGGTASNDDLGQPSPAGHPHARAVVADHLRRARVVAGADDAVVLTRGATDGMARVAAALVEAGHTHLLVEDPSWSVLRDVAGRVGLIPVPVPVDHAGADVDALVAASRRTGARAALLTPAHQFPTGSALAPERREAVLAWARAVDGVVVEDDYDAEFRYDRRPVAALQQLDPERVVLLGSVSKTMSPAFGVGWMVVPARWRESVMRAASPTHGAAAPSTVDQLTFARFVASGGYDRHLRGARGRYRRRRDAVLDALARELPDAAVSGIAAGMHALLSLPSAPDDPAPDAAHVVREAARREVTVVDLRRYQVRPADRSTTLVLGYGNLADARVDEAVARLADAVRSTRGTDVSPSGR
ncbi:PLP-dependent aminotransferase family protein [Cellulosimicrobium cellulans]|uniref:MocR-like pyridoxine biosynthesis transcription factor PdxR n=1 Tax=Cellulosimicrobium cellulans TaxID=1710 RepID=UPI0024069BD3|nr:PLP-dependent aminotransferase family protein [Cellulosimicrobium cellulans]MDF9878327.1 GntR family transcriptional regulator/MocR family aminotransferase [Cellulosimicrobium cellulans]